MRRIASHHWVRTAAESERFAVTLVGAARGGRIEKIHTVEEVAEKY